MRSDTVAASLSPARRVTAARLRPGTPLALKYPGLVSSWLFAISFMILMMVALGGATRLTGSGLSIMAWQPVAGILPPLSHAAWEHDFALYQHIPQYRLLHEGMGLSGFQHIFWLEWIHRFTGRMTGLVLFAPLLVFAWRRALSTRLIVRLAVFFVLGGLQGAIGWFMVSSGFDPNSTAVAPTRLVLHLCFALALYSGILWTALQVRQPAPAAIPPSRGALWTRRLAGLVPIMIGVTIVAGGFVAGTHAGFVYNTFPDMDGHLVPQHYDRLSPFWRNMFQNLAAVQFDHRVMATLTALTIGLTLLVGLRSRLDKSAHDALMLLGWAVLVQYCLGVTTLLLVVPVWAGTLHQTFAAILLGVALVTRFQLRRADLRPIPLSLRPEFPA